MKYITLLLASILCLATAHSQVIITSAGTGAAGFTGDGGPATAAMLYNPYGVTLDKDGNLYVCDNGNRRVRKISPAYGGIITTVAGNGTAGYSGDGLEAIYAQLSACWDVAVDKKGVVYIADGGHRIRKVSTDGIITTYAGTGTGGYNGDGIAATAAMLNGPTSVCVDDTGNLYFTDRDNIRIRKVDTFGIITTIAGTGSAGFRPDGSRADTSALDHIAYVRVGSDGTVYFRDDTRIRKINSAGSLVTVAGNGTYGYGGDGGLATAAAIAVNCLYIDHLGNCFFSDSYSERVRIVHADGSIATVAGQGAAGFSGDGGDPLLAKMNSPQGVAVETNGDIFIADLSNNRIRMVTTHLTGSPEREYAGTSVTCNPNPAGDFTIISLNGVSGTEGEVDIIAMDGRILDHFCITTNSPVTVTTPWSPGIYTVNITLDGSTYTKTLSIK